MIASWTKILLANTVGHGVIGLILVTYGIVLVLVCFTLSTVAFPVYASINGYSIRNFMELIMRIRRTKYLMYYPILYVNRLFLLFLLLDAYIEKQITSHMIIDTDKCGNISEFIELKAKEKKIRAYKLKSRLVTKPCKAFKSVRRFSQFQLLENALHC